MNFALCFFIKIMTFIEFILVTYTHLIVSVKAA